MEATQGHPVRAGIYEHAFAVGNAVAATERAATALHNARAALSTAVDEARAAGMTWAELGAVMGTNAEAVRKRFSSTPQ